MSLVVDPITVLNLAFDLVILGLGLFAYIKGKATMGGLVALGFGFFAISYILTILGYGSSTTLLLPLRVLGYVSVIAGVVVLLYQVWPKAPTSAPSPVGPH